MINSRKGVFSLRTSMPWLKNTPSDYDGVLDYIRVIAAVLVLTTHAVQSGLGVMEPESGEGIVFAVISVLTMVCNPLYIMLSGALLIPYKQEKPIYFYQKRFARVCIPMYIYYCIYYYLNCDWQGRGLGSLLWEPVGDLLRGNLARVPHYWILYVLLAFYVVIPFLRYMFWQMPYAILTTLAGIIFFFISLSYYLPGTVFLQPVHLGTAGWLGAAILGYWLVQPQTRQYDRLLMGGGALGVLIAVLLVKYHSGYWELSTGYSPILLMIGGGLFSGLYQWNSHRKLGNRLIHFLSEESFGVILIHMGILFFLVKKVLGVNITPEHPFLTLLLTIGITAVTSFGAAALVNHTAVRWLQDIFNRLMNKIMKN